MALPNMTVQTKAAKPVRTTTQTRGGQLNTGSVLKFVVGVVQILRQNANASKSSI